MNDEVSNHRKIDLDAAIDFELIKSEIAEKGPIRFSKPHLPIEMFLSIVPCICYEYDCKNDVVSVERKCGLSRIIWLLEPEELQKFKSLSEFSEWVLQFGLEDSRGERLIMEQAIENAIDTPYQAVEDLFCVCENCRAAAGSEVIWKNHLLTCMAINLQQRDEWREWVEDNLSDDENDLSAFFDDVFNLGYSIARMFSEYQLKMEVEEFALVGIKAKKHQEKRAEAAGKVSRQKREQRLDTLLKKMEDISQRNPDIARLNPKVLADLAIRDSIQDNPNLWKQGKGRRDEYLDEMKSDIRYRKRYKAIFG